MRVIFDHNVPRGLRDLLGGHFIRLTDEMGWAEFANGSLLKAAEEAGFEAMVTCDQNLSYQQNLTQRSLALVILNTNNWKDLKSNPEPIVAALNSATPGSFHSIQIPHQPKFPKAL